MDRDHIAVAYPALLDSSALAADELVQHGIESGLLGPNAPLVVGVHGAADDS